MVLDDVIYAHKARTEWNRSSAVANKSAMAGVVTTLTSDFFKDYSLEMMKGSTSHIESLKPSSYCSQQVVGDLFTTNLCVGNQIIKNYMIKEESSHLFIDPQTEKLNLRVSGVSLDFLFDFELSSEPRWLEDSGTGTISVYDTNIDLELDLMACAEEGTLKIDYSDVQIHTRDYDVNLDGTTDHSKAAEMMLTNFKSFFEEELTAILASKLLKIVEEQLMERAIGMSRDGEDDQVKGQKLMDRRLIADPVLTKHSISFIFEGTYHDKNAPVVGPDGEALPIERLG